MPNELSAELVEKAVLGTMLEENYLIVDSDLRPEHFTVQVHKAIFSGMRQLMLSGRGVDAIALLTVKEPVEVGGANYVVELGRFANPELFYEYVAVLLDWWRERQKQVVLQQAQQENWELARILKELDRISEEVHLQDTSITGYLKLAAERPFSPKSVRKGILTGLHDLDKLTNGFQEGELFLLAARPSMGKTDVLNHFAYYAGMHGYKPIIFSLEMKREVLIDRMLASVAGINRLKLRNPYRDMTEEQKNRWVQAVGELNTCGIEVDDRPGLTVAQIRSTARRIIKEYADLRPIVFIDYLQIIKPSDERALPTQQFGQISWDLKQMAREFCCPVVCLAQLNRSVESRSDKRPMMSDIRESGNIEQDADIIAFLYRDAYYNKDSSRPHEMEIILAKHRNGPTGKVRVEYRKETGRVLNLVVR